MVRFGDFWKCKTNLCKVNSSRDLKYWFQYRYFLFILTLICRSSFPWGLPWWSRLPRRLCSGARRAGRASYGLCPTCQTRSETLKLQTVISLRLMILIETQQNLETLMRKWGRWHTLPLEPPNQTLPPSANASRNPSSRSEDNRNTWN